MHDLIVGPLQERGVHRHDRPHALRCQPRRKRDGMLLCNPDIVQALRKFFFKGIQAGPFAHRRSDGHDPLVLTCQLHQGIDGDLSIGRPYGFLGRHAGFPHEGRAGMEPDRVLYGRLITQSLFRDDMEQDRAFHLENIFQGGQEMFEVMPVDRAGIAESELFKQQAGQNRALRQLFGTPREFLDIRPDMRNLP